MTIRTAAPAHRPGKPLTPQAERRRDQILEAALAVMSRKGFDRTSIADIAGRARVARATVYQHFADKRDVLVALANRVTFRVIEAASAWPPLPDAGAERPATREQRRAREVELRGLIEARLALVLQTVATNADAARLLVRLTPGADKLVDDTLRRMDEFVVGMVTKDIDTAQHYGWARACDSRMVARFILGGIERIVFRALDRDQALDIEKLTGELGALVFSSLRNEDYFDPDGGRRDGA
ncbi:MAG TPA: helix-turn-helix domain-containing protein [Candidatus Binatia bacterium]|nr:helix-turn-helix domain-containing protein [Candidatus Binatia bacterium]